MQIKSVDPLWDEGISSFLLGKYESLQAPITIENLQEFAVEQAVRVGDLLETLFIMAIYGEWTYSDVNGQTQKLDESALDDFYAKGRLSEGDLAAFSGVWAPA